VHLGGQPLGNGKTHAFLRQFAGTTALLPQAIGPWGGAEVGWGGGRGTTGPLRGPRRGGLRGPRRGGLAGKAQLSNSNQLSSSSRFPIQVRRSQRSCEAMTTAPG